MKATLSTGTTLITGASSGFGAELAVQIGAKGGTLLLVARRTDKLTEVAARVTAAGGTAHVFTCDVSEAKSVRDLAERVLSEHGAPDFLINNAGAGQFLFTEETEMEQAVQMMGAPYFAAFFLSRAFLPTMLERKSGHIVNVTSPACVFVWPGATAYTAARFAVQGFSEALFKDLVGTGVACSVIHPPEISDSEYNLTNAGSFDRIPGAAKLVGTRTVAYCARATIRGIQARRKSVVISPQLKLFYFLKWICPPLVDGLVRATGFSHKKLAG